MDTSSVEIISFYEFKELGPADLLPPLKQSLKDSMLEFGVRGTIIIACEGYNGMVCGPGPGLKDFVANVEKLFHTRMVTKSSFADSAPFRKTDVRIKPEIVTLKKSVDISLGSNTHVKPRDWNRIISDSETLVLDTRNDYEYKTGTFQGALNPNISKFSELPDFVADNLDPAKHKRVAMFCTGGIRCEKFAPYMRSLGFAEVYQLDGGILKYLEETEPAESLWRGECFVFDERITVDASLQKGTEPDLSQRRSAAKEHAERDG